ncbi:NifU-like protein [Candidatus Stoquefichus sp. KLE1796]|jgi:Fe-S cluster biogenesis protein NfuA|nr:NifU-like protein [Candidatus Stoquefichus sp. KLE1796]
MSLLYFKNYGIIWRTLGGRRMNQEEEIKKVIHKLRPYLQRDGGDIEFIKFEDGIVYVQMHGACAGCTMLDATLKDGVEQILIEEVPGVLEVQAI